MGETPLQAIDRVRQENHSILDAKITYAGRLDPMAEGLLVLLVGDEVHKKDKFLSLNKTYEVEVLFGFSTDTYDILGLVKENKELNFENFKLEIENFLRKLPRKFSQAYPPFSLKTIGRKQMFVLAKSGELEDKEIPTKQVEIFSTELLDIKTISKLDLEKIIFERIALVSGDFRQEEIKKAWRDSFNRAESVFSVAKIKIKASSGFYARSFANSMGVDLNIPALALSILRTQIGKFKI